MPSKTKSVKTNEWVGRNHRKVLAGQHMLAGKSVKQSLIAAGYAESTASVPGSHGLSADVCIPEALAIEGPEGSHKLVQAIRRAVLLKVQAVSKDDHALSKAKLGELSRAMDTIEKYHGAGAGDVDGLGDVRTFAERLKWIQALAIEMKGDDVITVDVETVEGD